MIIDDNIHKKIVEENDKIKDFDSFKNEEQTINFFRTLIDEEQSRILKLIYMYDEDKFINHFSSVLLAHYFYLNRDTEESKKLNFKMSLAISKKIEGFEKEFKK